MLKNWELPCFFLVKPKTPNNGFPDSDGWSMIFLGRLDAFAWNILRHVLITVQYHQKSIALICIDRVSWKSRMHSSKELHPRTSKCQWCQFLMFDPTLALTDLRLALIFIFEIKATNKTIDFLILSFWVLDVQILKPWYSLAYRTETQVVEAKNMAQKRIGDEEEKSRVLQLEVQILKKISRDRVLGTQKREILSCTCRQGYRLCPTISNMKSCNPMIPVYVQLRIGSRIFFHNWSWEFATKQGSVCDRAAQPRMLGRDLCWEFSGGSLFGKDWQREKGGKPFCSGISEFLLARCALQSFLIEGSLGGHASSKFYRSLQVTCFRPRLLREWKPSENKKNSCRLKRRKGGRSKFRMVQVSEIGFLLEGIQTT